MRALIAGLLICASSSAFAGPTARFILMGDGGTGSKAQFDVAAAIGKVCEGQGCDFAVHAGDNIYEYGAKSETDPQFNDKFEKPYSSLNFPIYMALGNHDQSGTIPGSGVYPEVGEFEIAYTKNSKKWKMPARFYALEWGAPKPLATILVIDTNPLAPQQMPQRDWYRPGARFDLSQRKWVREKIAKAKTPWIFVVGHHPYLNNGRHGSAGHFGGIGLSNGEELKKFYEEEICGKVDFIVAGHDHSLQLLKPTKKCGPRTHFIVSGAAAKTYSDYDPKTKKQELNGSYDTSFVNQAYWEIYGKLGFFKVDLTAKDATFTGYTLDEKKAPVSQFKMSVSAFR